MTKAGLITYIGNHYWDVMTITHDEMMRCSKKDLENYLQDLQKQYGMRE